MSQPGLHDNLAYTSEPQNRSPVRLVSFKKFKSSNYAQKAKIDLHASALPEEDFFYDVNEL
jgi:hypothetical protein